MPPGNNGNNNTGRENFVDKSTKKINSRPTVLRTFSSDMAEAIKSGEASVVKIAMAEQKKKTAEYENFSPASRKNKAFIAGSSVLVALGIIAVGYYFLYMRKDATPKVTDSTPQIQSLVYADENKGYDVTGLLKNQVQTMIKNDVEKVTLKDGGVLYMYFITKSGDVATKLGAQAFFTTVASSIPGRASRSLQNEFMVGVHKGVSSGANTPFMLLNTSDYDNMYAGLLEWEKKMVDDFFTMFDISVSGERAYLLAKPFQDTTIRNIDVRTLLDKDGKTILLYGFVNQNTVIITTTQETFAEIMTRYNASRIRR